MTHFLSFEFILEDLIAESFSRNSSSEISCSFAPDLDAASNACADARNSISKGIFQSFIRDVTSAELFRAYSSKLIHREIISFIFDSFIGKWNSVKLGICGDAREADKWRKVFRAYSLNCFELD